MNGNKRGPEDTFAAAAREGVWMEKSDGPWWGWTARAKESVAEKVIE